MILHKIADGESKIRYENHGMGTIVLVARSVSGMQRKSGEPFSDKLGKYFMPKPDRPLVSGKSFTIRVLPVPLIRPLRGKGEISPSGKWA